FESPYLGVAFTNREIEDLLQGRKLRYRRVENIAKEAAQSIAEGKIVGWFQGRMEAGPRALGNRSITVTPMDPTMKQRLNDKVKKREFFRPFAPSVLEEKAYEYFDMPKGSASPYMILVGDVREDKRAVLPAITHADGTARVHTVKRDVNPLYWELIREFEKITGVPVLLNTSFNENEPIVCTPLQAVECFLRTEMDLLAIGDFVVTKDGATMADRRTVQEA
ncbi:carbamoyltransferase C-terminal domain-containing protein, partial [Thermodesulfobacteriota bacterium]